MNTIKIRTIELNLNVNYLQLKDGYEIELEITTIKKGEKVE